MALVENLLMASTLTVATAVVKMGSYIPFLSSYATVKVDAINKFSTKAMVTVMPTEKMVKFTVEPEIPVEGTEGTTIFKVRVTPSTIFTIYPLRPSATNKPNYDVITVNTVPTVEWETEVQGQGIGLPMKFKTEYPSVLNILKPTLTLSPLCGLRSNSSPTSTL